MARTLTPEFELISCDCGNVERDFYFQGIPPQNTPVYRGGEQFELISCDCGNVERDFYFRGIPPQNTPVYRDSYVQKLFAA